MVITRFVLEWFAGRNCIILRSQIPVLPLCWRVARKNNFSTIKWYNLCLQIIQSQKCYPLNIIICKEHHSALLGVWYVTAHICAGGLKKKLDIRSGSQSQRHFVGFFNVPVQAPTPFLHSYFEKPPHLVAFYDTLGIRRTHSRFNPPPPRGPNGGTNDEVACPASVCLSVCLSVCPVSWPWKCFK